MLRELQRFADERVTPIELAQATSYLAGQTAVNRQSASAVAGEMLEAWLSGGGLTDLEDPAAKYRTVTAEAIRDVAAATLAGSRAEGVVRGKAQD
jgi:predicted Zn-dependent peptidase